LTEYSLIIIIIIIITFGPKFAPKKNAETNILSDSSDVSY
jgi:hypothetical protein